MLYIKYFYTRPFILYVRCYSGEYVIPKKVSKKAKEWTAEKVFRCYPDIIVESSVQPSSLVETCNHSMISSSPQLFFFRWHHNVRIIFVSQYVDRLL